MSSYSRELCSIMRSDASSFDPLSCNSTVPQNHLLLDFEIKKQFVWVGRGEREGAEGEVFM